MIFVIKITGERFKLDPITAFAMANAALAAIRKGVDFYKEAQAAAKDVSEVATDITGHIGKFLDAKSVIQEAAEEVNKEPENDEEPAHRTIDTLFFSHKKAQKGTKTSYTD